MKIALFIRNNKLLALILLIALFVRATGTIPGHSPDHPDEPMSYSSAVEMILHGDLNPRRFDYPSGVPLLHLIFINSFILPALLLKVFLYHPEGIILNFINTDFINQFSTEIFGVGHTDALFWSRILTALIGTLSVYIVYLAGKKLFNETVGLSSAFFLAVNYRHVLSSHLALSDVPNSFFAILAFYACILLWESNTRKRYILAGLCVGLSFSMKYQIFTLLPLLFVQFLWVLKKQKINELYNKNFLIALLLIPLVFVVLNPYLLLNLQTAIPVIQYVGIKYGSGINKFNFYPLYYLFYFGIGTLSFLAIIFGLVIALRKTFLKSFFILSYIAPFLYVFLYYMGGGSYIRNFTTVMPFLSLFFGLFVFFVVEKLKLKKGAIFIVILAILNLPSIVNSATLSFNYSKQWNRSVLQSWVDKNIPENSIVRVSSINIGYSPDKPLKIFPWEHTEINSIFEFQDNKDEFAIINTDWYQLYTFWFGSTSPSELIRYPGIPYDKLKGSYYGLAFSEFKHYTVYEIYKPWQSPDNNYLVIKIPQKPKERGVLIKEFKFDKGLENWKYYDFSFNKGKSDMLWSSQNGRSKEGSIEFNANTANGENSMFSSPYIKIKPGKTYTVEGFIKPDNILTNQRDGFLRVGFFENSKNITSQSLFTAVSGRVYGKDWKQEKIIAKAPDNSNYMTVSFQRSYPNPMFHYLLDDISVYESSEMRETFKNIPYIAPTIPDNVVFANSVF